MNFRKISPAVLTLPFLSACERETRYAAWISFDLSLIAVSFLLGSLLASAWLLSYGQSMSRSQRFISWFVVALAIAVLNMLLTAFLFGYPSIKVHSVFPYP